MFNLRNKNCQKLFFEDTSKTKLLTASLENKNAMDGGKSWLKNLNTVIHRNFKKIRITVNQKDEMYKTVIKKKRGKFEFNGRGNYKSDL